jgi:hypothetical protein
MAVLPKVHPAFGYPDPKEIAVFNEADQAIPKRGPHDPPGHTKRIHISDLRVYRPRNLHSLRLAGSNPSVLGFFTEQMILSWISVNGCPLGGKEFAVPLKTITFPGKKPALDPDVGFSLYVPTSFNFRAVDAVMVFQNKARTEAVVVGVQITISKTHSDSETKFFADWQWWESVLGCSKVSFR